MCAQVFELSCTQTNKLFVKKQYVITTASFPHFVSFTSKGNHLEHTYQHDHHFINVCVCGGGGADGRPRHWQDVIGTISSPTAVIHSHHTSSISDIICSLRGMREGKGGRKAK